MRTAQDVARRAMCAVSRSPAGCADANCGLGYFGTSTASKTGLPGGRQPEWNLRSPESMPAPPPQTAPFDSRAVVLLRNGNAHVAAGRYREALPCYEQALKLEPRACRSVDQPRAARWPVLDVAAGRGGLSSRAAVEPRSHPDGAQQSRRRTEQAWPLRHGARLFRGRARPPSDFTQAYVNLAHALFHEGRIDDAIAR